MLKVDELESSGREGKGREVDDDGGHSGESDVSEVGGETWESYFDFV